MPAAQYMRMSTGLQEYSLSNQADAILRYAIAHSFEIVETYADAAKSGLALKGRSHLQRLLADVQSGNAPYRAILVYDVSRWGRFQDTDESAHWEFICKSAGIPVHYCVEQFANDGSIPSVLLKTLKRVMAGEFSRDLSAKVYAGKKNAILKGFSSGGFASYGFQRILVSSDPKRHERVLLKGERKAIQTDRIVFSPGPPEEIECVRTIFKMAISGMTARAIAEELNRTGAPCRGTKWTAHLVLCILHNRRCVGTNVWGKTSQKLHSGRVPVPEHEWVSKEHSCDPIVDQQTFDEAQQALHKRTIFRPNEELVNRFSEVFKRAGYMSASLMDSTGGIPTSGTVRRRFGSLERLYELIGYDPPQFNPALFLNRRRVAKIRRHIADKLTAMIPGSCRKVDGCNRPVLTLPNGVSVAIIVCRCVTGVKTASWEIPRDSARSGPVLLVRTKAGNKSILDMRLLPSLEVNIRIRIRESHPIFESAGPFRTLREAKGSLRQLR